MDTLIQDIRFGARSFAGKPALAAIIILTLGLGIGANSAIFSVVDSVLLKPLKYAGAERIVTIWEDFSRKGGPEQEWIEVPNFFYWKEHSDSFQAMSAFGYAARNLLGGGEPERLLAGRVSWDFFDVFAIEPTQGRGFRPEDDRPGAPPVAILSHEFWQRRMGGDESALDKPLMLNGQAVSVVGILPRGFNLPLGPPVDLWTPLRLDPQKAERGNFFLRCVARLKPGVGVPAAQAELDAMMERIGEQFPINEDVGIQIVPLKEQLVGSAREALLALLAVVAFVLLIACANVANLMLSRAAARRREMGVRSALGAGRRRLLRQLLTESVMLAAAGGVLGLVLALAGVQAITAWAPDNTPRLEEVAVDWRVVLFTLAVSLLTGVLFGLAPARSASRTDVAAALKDASGLRDSVAGGRLRTWLVVGEVALAVLLLVGAGLLARSFSRLINVAVGFEPDNLLAAQLMLPRDQYPQPASLHAFWDTLMERLEGRPEVDSAAAVSVLPLSGADSDTGFRIVGRPEPEPGQGPTAWYRLVTPGYLKTMRIPVLAGRGLERMDRDSAAPAVAVSQPLAQRYWPDTPPQEVVGEQLALGSRVATIVGVVGGVRHNSLQREPRPEMYIPIDFVPARNLNVVVRSKSDPESLAAAIRSEVRHMDPDLPVANIQTLGDLVARSAAPDRFVMSLTAGFAALALALAAVGIYGVAAVGVAARTREMGLRMALGASRRQVLSLILKKGLLNAGAGLFIGLAAAYALTRLISGLLFEISASDLPSYLAAAAALALIALAANLFPALRATRIDPWRALRYE